MSNKSEKIDLSACLDRYAEDGGAQILQEFKQAKQSGTLCEMPVDLDAKCTGLIEESFSGSRKPSRSKKIGSSMVRAATAAVVVLGISTATVLSVDAFRVPVLNFLMDQSGKFSTVVVEPGFEQLSPETDRVLELFEKFIPVGYRVHSNDFTGTHGTLYYKGPGDSVIYLQAEISTNILNVDSEDVERQTVEFGDYYAVLWEKRGYHLMWLDDENQTIYTLYASDLEEERFWELAYALIG